MERLGIRQIQRMGMPARSKSSLVAENLPTPTSDWGYVKGGNLAAGLAAGLKGYLGMRGALEDSRNQQAYNDYLVQSAEQDRADQLAQNEINNNLQYMKMGINPNRLGEEGYLDARLEANAKNSANQAKGEFGYAMSVIQSPEFQNMPESEKQLWLDFAKTKAKGLEDTYAQAYQNALGAGKGKLETAQDLSTAEAIGRNLLTQGTDGKLTPIKGTKEEVKQAEKKTEFMNAMRNKLEQSDMILGYIDQALELADKNPLSVGYGSFIGNVYPYGDAAKMKSLLASIKGNVGLKQLIESKAEGATYGALSEKELQMLQDVMGRLDQGQSPEVLKQVLQNVRSNYKRVRDRANAALYGSGIQAQPAQEQPAQQVQPAKNVTLDDVWGQ